jgi:hypothetical protein
MDGVRRRGFIHKTHEKMTAFAFALRRQRPENHRYIDRHGVSADSEAYVFCIEKAQRQP